MEISLVGCIPPSNESAGTRDMRCSDVHTPDVHKPNVHRPGAHKPNIYTPTTLDMNASVPDVSATEIQPRLDLRCRPLWRECKRWNKLGAAAPRPPLSAALGFSAAARGSPSRSFNLLPPMCRLQYVSSPWRGAPQIHPSLRLAFTTPRRAGARAIARTPAQRSAVHATRRSGRIRSAPLRPAGRQIFGYHRRVMSVKE